MCDNVKEKQRARVSAASDASSLHVELFIDHSSSIARELFPPDTLSGRGIAWSTHSAMTHRAAR
jgi:hypothetical protein